MASHSSSSSSDLETSPSLKSPLCPPATVPLPPSPSASKSSISSGSNSDEGYSVPAALKWGLYLSHAMSTWNARAFEFGAVLFLAHIYPSTLLCLSVYALVRAGSAVVFGAPIGWVVDGFDRLGVVRGSIGACPVTVPLELNDAKQGMMKLLVGWLFNCLL